ncbi:glycosyltransferase [Roseateles koreensis]|uniref:Glycosyltransferase n=1 Tax=Roseateles koreensis TaxID=2987526 RepID=A0ABT5KV31_9BURK|nr:glycosyltransferase [Roseateles koreensis]MDC8786687.1 glycosyltransferase [Roseateles koreensis]
MRILLLHNHYRFPGGEDAVVNDELNLLLEHGHDVDIIERTNESIHDHSAWAAGLSAVWSRGSYHEVEHAIKKFRPDIVHAHNTFPLISPSAYWAATSLGIPVVQTLHNFRNICANALMLRDGKTCEQCIGKIPWRGVVHKCYRNSGLQSLSLVSMLTLHQVIGSYKNKINTYIALNEYCRQKFVAGGLPGDRIVVKPNFSTDPGEFPIENRSGFLYVGRLSEEKGLHTLIKAANASQQRITVIGDGPLVHEARKCQMLDVRGHCDRATVLALMARASYLIVPSIWYENMPRTVIEAFSCGLPVIASNIGALTDLVKHGVTGLQFPVGDASALASILTAAAKQDHATARSMHEGARAEYLKQYIPAKNYEHLLGIYEYAQAHPI